MEITQGNTLTSTEAQPSWEASDPPKDQDLSRKFHDLMQAVLPRPDAMALERLIWNVGKQSDAGELVELLATEAVFERTNENGSKKT